MKVTCPKNKNHKRFTTVAHVMEEWLVNEHGEFIDVRETLQVDHGPDAGNVWVCDVCGAEAKVEN